ncbi:hypothetical protein Pcinc_039240 [Petrolisthes cinctipes]|uniref:Uncharacterized protein n=1 Tax=Petrolisthes cinctipes TaxID=88211 RepID=A0AAE1BPA1_PETCI|nr:hypothetical protein Pcinc_039240 [Petrolisthes cinctipes]
MAQRPSPHVLVLCQPQDASDSLPPLVPTLPQLPTPPTTSLSLLLQPPYMPHPPQPPTPPPPHPSPPASNYHISAPTPPPTTSLPLPLQPPCPYPYPSSPHDLPTTPLNHLLHHHTLQSTASPPAPRHTCLTSLFHHQLPLFLTPPTTPPTPSQSAPCPTPFTLSSFDSTPICSLPPPFIPDTPTNPSIRWSEVERCEGGVCGWVEES